MTEPTHIVVRSARSHNLRGVDLEIPRNAMVVFTGVSGSGKSSLVYDTLYKEGQRRFMESLSAYARQFLGQMERPDVDAVEGISPTLAIDQKTVNRNPRSTVGTITEIYDHLRLLMARLGTPHCPVCAKEISRLGVEQVVELVLTEGDGRRIQVLAPVVRERKGEYRREMEDLARDGWVRARVDGVMIRLEEPPTLERYKRHTIEVVVDRLKGSAAEHGRLTEAIESALRMADQVVTLLIDDTEHTFSTDRACADHPEQAVPELEPRLFSFNSPQGACPGCNGLGELAAFQVDRMVDLRRSMPEAVRLFNDEGKIPFARFDHANLVSVVASIGADWDAPLGSWSEAHRHALLYGDPSIRYTQVLERAGGRRDVRDREWSGLFTLTERIYHFTKHTFFDTFRVSSRCTECGGSRLSAIARSITFRERGIHELSVLTVDDAHAFFQDLDLEAEEAEVGALLIREVVDRLSFLVDVGLGYLSLDRSATTLSGGESQRIRLASQVGSALQGVTYILDEPSIGLHPRDNLRLLGAMRRLRDRGNSLLVVEHDADTILAADWVVDVGPGAGREGGLITASGPPEAFLRSDCLTARYLRGELSIPIPEVRRTGSGLCLGVRGAVANNLKGLDVDLPLGTLTVVTGVSGSGKSSLLFQVFEPSIRSGLAGEPTLHGCAELVGLEHIDKLIRINQRPIGRTPRSNPATYTGAMDLLRDLFAATAESRARGYTKGRFSFNVKGGRCEDCFGAGVKTVEMQFLPDVVVPCETCQGRRFNRETLDVRFKGLTISETLNLTIGDALALFENIPKLARILRTLVDVGLDYVSLGQPSTTLSGGEAQRMKLASELHRPATGRTLYLLDEPTTGLHMHDVGKLLVALDRLVESGNTVVVVEHHSDVIRHADHVIDLGPEGGIGGGEIAGLGTPEQVALLDTPTGQALAAMEGGALAPIAAEMNATYTPSVVKPRTLLVRGARKHNLQSVDVEIPHGQMTVITGVSGSGKTSLAFDTIFAEGQRRYVESLSTYARRFLGRLEHAPVERLEGVQPAIAIDQASASHNPRSTVATVTEVHDVLRLLYARVGTPHCPTCDREVVSSTPSRVASELRAEARGAGWLVTQLASDPESAERRQLLIRDGWSKLWVPSQPPAELPLEDPACEPLLAEGAWLVVDRLDPAKVARDRVTEAVSHAYKLGHGRVRFVGRKSSTDLRFTEGLVCSEHGIVVAGELTPRHFSFNSRLGACPRCEGIGSVQVLTPSALFRDRTVGIWQGLEPGVAKVLKASKRTVGLVDALIEAFDLTREAPISVWAPELHTAFLHGLEGELSVTWTKRWGSSVVTTEESLVWGGLLATLQQRKRDASWSTRAVPCPACHGGRLGGPMLAVRLGGLDIRTFARQTVDATRETVAGWVFDGEAAVIAERAVVELGHRLRFLSDVGLGYLALDRQASTLSGGESQRIRLASQLGSQLTGVTYVLDEPTVGLHPRDTDRLLDTLEGLRDLGNTVLVVEHDPDTIVRADYVIDMGPAAGVHGGHVIASGTPAQIEADPASVTGRWLSGESSVPGRTTRRRVPRSWVAIKRPRANNLRAAKARIPFGVWTVVSGVSGSGKSSLVMDTLAPALRQSIGLEASPGPHAGMTVDEVVDGVVVVDQSPLGRSPRSTPGTYVGVMDRLRRLFAEIPGARERGFKPGRFSFNSKGGRCEMCEGRGATLIEMHFLPDVWITCVSCRGRRFERDTLEVRWKGHSIADVLAMRIDEAVDLFSAQRLIHRSLQALVDVGLGYVALGQPSTTLSGGEAQRVKLAAELVSRKGHRVYVLDEPTTGLHMEDISKLVAVLHRLVEQGHTVITIEHHLEMIRQADWVVDMGPDGGAAGGLVVAAGTPEKVAKSATATGLALRA